MQITSLLKRAAFAVAAVSCGAVLAAEDFSAYAHKASVTFSGYEGATALTNFPALVRLAEGVGGFSYADCAQTNGGDVRFTLGDGLELASECVKWDTTGESQFWVRVPELTQDAVIYMCWGNANAQVRSQVPSVWSDAYTAVWTLESDGLAIIDVSGNGNHGSASRTLASVSGVVGTARSFSSANSDYARAGKGYDDSFSSPSFSYEGWFKAEANPSSTCSLFGYSTQDGNYNSAATLRDIQLATDGKIIFRLEDKSYTSSTAVEPGSWHHVAATYDAGTKAYALYLDGAVAVSGTFNGKNYAYDPLDRFQFANANHINQKLFFDGILDELRISRLALPADYFAAVHKNLTDTANFIEIEDLGSEPLPSVESLPQTVTISLSAEAGGTVTPSGDVVVEKGGFLEVTASYPTADRLFYAWDGDCPTTAVFSATIRVPADRDRTLVARFGTAYYISPSVESDAIKAGLNQIATDAEGDPSVLPAVLQLADGTYPLTDAYVKSGYAYTIATPIAVRAATAGNAILDFKGVDGKTCDGRSAFKLDSMGAVIDGLTFMNASEHAAYSDNAVVALVNKGHLLNCTVDAFRERSDSDCCVKVNAGWISRCRFLNATSVQTGTRSYPVTLAGGTLMDSCIVSNFCGSMATVGLAGTARNCLFIDCSAKHASSGKGGAIQFLHGDGKTGALGKGVTACAENCTFVNCSAIYGGALAYAQSSVQPVAINCAFLGNAAANAAQGHDVYQVTLVNCVSANAEAEDGTVVSLPVFTDVIGEPAANSPTRNAGLYARWTTQGEGMDLVGTNRIEEGVLDIGCREFPKPGREPLAVNVTASAYEGRDALVTTFTPTVTGDKTGLTYAWNFGDGTATSSDAEPTHTYASCGYYTVTLTVANDAGESSVFTKDSFVRVLPSTCYVRAAGESVPTSPYATPETAADRLCDVLPIMPTTIDLGEGDIELGDFCNVTQPMVIRGKGPEKTRLKADAKGLGDFASEVRPVFLKHKGAVLADVTVRINGSCNWSTPVGVQAGLVTNCVVCGNRSQNPTAVDIVSGALIGCTFSGNTNTYDSSGAVRISGGGVRIENCVFRENLSGNVDSDSSGSALRVDGNYSPAPVVRNCLFFRNCQASAEGFGVIYANGAVTFDNCTVASNAWTVTRGGGGLRIGTSAPAGGVVCRNSIFWSNVGSDDGADIRYPDGNAPVLTACSIGVNPQFKDPTRDDWRIRGGSPCKNAGVKLEWMTDEVTDIIGNPRIYGGAPDIGCYENQAGGLMMLVR